MKAIVKDVLILLILVTALGALMFTIVQNTPKRFSKEHLQSLGFKVK